MKFSHRFVSKAKRKAERGYKLQPKEKWAIVKAERLYIFRGKNARKIGLTALIAAMSASQIAQIRFAQGASPQQKAIAIAQQIIYTAQAIQKVFAD